MQNSGGAGGVRGVGGGTLSAVAAPTRDVRALRVGQDGRLPQKGTVQIVKAVQGVPVPETARNDCLLST